MKSEATTLHMSATGGLVDARFRLMAAIIVGPASVYLVGFASGTIARIFGVVGVLIALMWAGGYRRAVRTPPDGRTLTFSADEIVLTSGEHTERAAWSAVTDVDVEDDAATLVVRSGDGTILRIEPGYGDLDTVALHELLERYRRGAISSTHG